MSSRPSDSAASANGLHMIKRFKKLLKFVCLYSLMLDGIANHGIVLLDGLRQERCVLQIMASTDLSKANNFLKPHGKIIY